MLDDTRRGWKAKARDRCREIIAAIENGELVTGDDAEFLLWLLNRHPRAVNRRLRVRWCLPTTRFISGYCF